MPASDGHAFHVRGTARERYAIDGTLLGLRGDLIVGDVAAMRRLADRMNEDRPTGAPGVGAGEIGALGVLHELGHLLIARYEATRRPDAMAGALREVRSRLGEREAARLLDRFGAAFPAFGPEPEPELRPPGGAAADADRQREPGDRSAA